ncbi:MAG: hypothetical protein LH618_08255 [Saprospiraceae bacterium]|nr:hypothetical protein [Saprospiraceae bacterium]
MLDIDAVSIQPVTVEMQHTRERKADFVALVIDQEQTKFLVHIEFQVRDDPKMLYRMLDYAALEARKYPGVELRQYVIYLGAYRPSTSTELFQRDIQYRYNAIWLRDVPVEQFLESEFPEEILFAVLAKFPESQTSEIVERVIENIRKRAGQTLEFERFSEQLRILGKLRNLQPLIEILMEKISRYVSMEDDPWFIKGKLEGEQKGKLEGELEGEQKGKLEKQRQFVINLIEATDFDDTKIASLADADIAFVKQIRAELQAS